MKKNDLYPITYQGKVLYEEDCSPLFAAYYTCKEALLPDMSVCVSNADDIYVFPIEDDE